MNTKTKGVGIGISGDGVGIGMGSAKSVGIHQTDLARQAAPPKTDDFIFGMVFGMIAFSIAAYIMTGWFFVGTVACLVGLIANGGSAAKRNKDAQANWATEKICLRCGSKFY